MDHFAYKLPKHILFILQMATPRISHQTATYIQIIALSLLNKIPLAPKVNKKNIQLYANATIVALITRMRSNACTS